MPLILSERKPGLVENMDRPDCDLTRLRNTYAQFHRINALLSKWKNIYRRHVRPVLRSDGINSILDIGFGGGDIPLQISRWIREDGLNAEITAIDTDRRSYDFVSGLNAPENIQFLHCSSSDMLKKGAKFDVVLSNHLLHHLEGEELLPLLRECEQLSTQKVIFNDIERSDLGYAAFSVFSRLLFRNSFITEDGLISIRKSYTATELRESVPSDWKVHRSFPYRLILTYEH